MSKPDKVKVEVNKRHDKKYNVWQYFTVSDAVRNNNLRGIFHQFFDSSDFDSEELMDKTHNRIIGRWIIVSVQRNKLQNFVRRHGEGNVLKVTMSYLLRTYDVIKVIDKVFYHL